jgi:TrmH family RNA methyltransferase
MREAITSRKNPLVQRVRAVRDGRELGRVFVEGVRLCEEALRASVEFELALHTRALEEEERGARLLKKLRAVCKAVQPVAEDVLASASDTKTPQGIVAIALRPQTGLAAVERAEGVPLVVVIHGANNPSNAGAMLRVAEAAGATAVIATQGSTDLLSAKALRGSMGSAFRLPIWTGPTYEEARSAPRPTRLPSTPRLTGRGRAPSSSGRRRAGSPTKRRAPPTSACASPCGDPWRA